MMNKNKFSLYFILGLIIVITASASISIISTYSYLKTKNKLQSSIYDRSNNTLDKLQQLLPPYIESYSVAEYNNILQVEMKDTNIYAIIVRDYTMGKVLGTESFKTGKIRDNNWDIIDYDEFDTSLNDYLKTLYYTNQQEVIGKSGQKLATIFIYSTDKFMQEQLDGIIKDSIIFTILISLVLFILSYILIHRVIIVPLKNIIKIMSHNSSNKISLKPIPQKGFKEIYLLSSSINHMIHSINQSQEQLNDLNKNLNKIVEEKTKTLQVLNYTLEEKIKVELEKNRQKDILLHNQSRFASMGEMVGNIAHQWRQPLNALSITVQKIQRYYEMGKLDEQTLDKSIDKSMNLIQKMSSTVDDFMGFFRADKVKMPFNLSDAIDETISLLESSIKNNFIELHFEKPPKTITIDGFKGEFTQVILNIISNSKDAIIENNIVNPHIDITIKKEADLVTIEISDNAKGIANDIIDKVFDPYFTTKKNNKGTGIGLYMSKMIIEQNMNGTLDVSNTNDGACFTIKLNCIE